MSKDRHVFFELPTGRLEMWVQEAEGRYCCIHVRDGKPADKPYGTLTQKVGKHRGRVYSWQLCRICGAMHTQSPEQETEIASRTALLRIMHEDELRDD